MNQNSTENKRVSLCMAAIDKYIEDTIVRPTEIENKSKGFVLWGEKNDYPDYLLALYENVATLQSVINGTVDFIVGDKVTIPGLNGLPMDMVNRKETIREQVKKVALDLTLYGAFALQVIRNKGGEVAEVHYIDIRYLRTDKECEVFYYSENWSKGFRKDVLVYPAFRKDINWTELDEEQRKNVSSSILYVKTNHKHVYAQPPYAGALKACEMERRINDFHLNDLENHFTPSVMVTFCNGVPEPNEMDEVTNDLNEKYAGYQNAGRMIASFAPSRTNAPIVERLNMDDFGERYQALALRSRQDIFTAFRATPTIFGIPTDNNGFSNDDYEGAFKLYNRTCVRPSQAVICDAYDKIYGETGVLTITPFSLEKDEETNVN